MKNLKHYIIITFALIFGLTISAASIENEIKDPKKGGDLKTEIKEYINHHLKDSHSFSITSWIDEETGKKVYLEVPLPVILYDNGFHFFITRNLSNINHIEMLKSVSLRFFFLS